MKRLLLVAAITIFAVIANAVEYKFDLGGGPVAEGYVGVTTADTYTTERGYGWIAPTKAKDRLRETPDALLRDFAFADEPATFRVDLSDGIYTVSITAGDMLYSNHATRVAVNSPGVQFPFLDPSRALFVTGTAAFTVDDYLELTFTHEQVNWVVNAITIAPASEVAPGKVTMRDFNPPEVPKNPMLAPDPTVPYWERFLRDSAKTTEFETTGVTREDYLKLIAGNVDYFKQHQDANGAIIDPYRQEEFQYSTPAFALSAATLVKYAAREDLLEPACKAMDWATKTLGEGRGANHHEDFYPPMLAHALSILAEYAAPERVAAWRKNLRYGTQVYRARPGRGNWNLVATAGEAQLFLLGLRDDWNWVDECLEGQYDYFTPWGMYKDPNAPLAYDLFPRLWLADMLGQGYSGVWQTEYAELMKRGAVTSLFLQSPSGEWPAGGRSAHHQWNEAQQVAHFEIYAQFAQADRDVNRAGIYKRAARRAFQSMQRWQRPTGEMWIVKNRMPPEARHGFESYSAHSQYNLLPMAMLSIAHSYALNTDKIAEKPAPAETGGFVLDLRDDFRKVIANAGGTYIEIDTGGQVGYNPTGLIRVHSIGLNPQLGPSDGLVKKGDDGMNVAVGASWQGKDGSWRSLAEFTRDQVREVAFHSIVEEKERVEFELTYLGDFDNVYSVTEHYLVRPGDVLLTVTLNDYDGPNRMTVPLLASDGERETSIEALDRAVRISLDDSAQTFYFSDASTLEIGENLLPYRNGMARVAYANHSTNKLSVRILPNFDPAHSSFAELPAPPAAPAVAVPEKSLDPFDPATIREQMKKVFRYTIAHPNSAQDNAWERAAFYTGVMGAYHATKDEEYLKEAIRWAEANKWQLADNRQGFWFADNQTCAQVYAEIYMLQGGEEKLAHARKIIDEMVAKPPVGREEWWWCDALYMAPPMFVRLSEATGDQRYIDLMNLLYWDSTDFLYDKEDHLFYRDKNFFPPRTTANGQKIFWSRGNGWVLGGLARVLQYLPEDNERHADYVQLYRDMAQRIAGVQGEDGLWRTSLLDYRELPMHETSGTGFYCFAMAWGVNNGYLERSENEPVVRNAWAGLNRCVYPDGKLGWVQYVAGAPGVVSPHQMREYAPGAFLLSGAEMLKLIE